MPCIWGQHNSSQLILPFAILPVQGQSPALPVEGQPPAQGAPAVLFKGLIDTGATTSLISTAIANQLNLQPIGRVPVHGVGGIQHLNSYLFMVGFPFAFPPGAPLPAGVAQPAPGMQPVQLHVLSQPIQGCEYRGQTSAFDAIIGMDVLRTGSLVVQGNGTFSFSF